MSCFLDIWLAMLVCAAREFPLPDWQPSSACDEMAWRNGQTLNTFASSGGLFPYRERLTQLGETDGNLFNVFESPCRKKIQLEFARISHFGSLQFFSFISSKISNACYFSCCEFISTVTRLFDDASLAWVCSTWEMRNLLHVCPSTFRPVNYSTVSTLPPASAVRATVGRRAQKTLGNINYSFHCQWRSPQGCAERLF